MTEISTNYDNRLVDLLIFQNVDPLRKKEVYLGLGDEGYVCTGIQKVAQTFLVNFLTDRGSNPWDLLKGTDFLPNLRAGLIIDDNTLQAEFQIALLESTEYIRRNTPADTPDDEQFRTADLMSWDISNGKLTMYIKVESVAGESRDYIVPVTVAIR